MKQFLRLRGVSDNVKDMIWGSESHLQIGRDDGLEIVLKRSSVSRRHAEIRVVNDRWWIRDLNSRNGTYVNGTRLGCGVRQIQCGDSVVVGEIVLKAEVSVLDEIIHLPANPNTNHDATAKSNQAEAERKGIGGWAMERIGGLFSGRAAKQEPPTTTHLWAEAKKRHPGFLVVFGVGAIYEAFDNDAQLLADACGLVSDEVGMHKHVCFRSADLEKHLEKLLDYGFRIAVCDRVAEIRVGEPFVGGKVRSVGTATVF